MSAWQLDKEHIDAMIYGAMKWWVEFNGEVVTQENATAIGQKLVNENFRSLQARYGRDQYPTPYRYTYRHGLALSNGSLFKQIRCYDYQTCEHDTWEHSDAYKFCSDMCLILSDRGELSDAAIALDEGPWGIWAYENPVYLDESDPDLDIGDVMAVLDHAENGCRALELTTD